MGYWEALILGIIEGITEFLPISSTGHMIIASHFMGIADQSFTKAFEVIIQFGAILSVLVLYWRRFLPNLAFYKKLLIAFLPTALIGFLAKDLVDQMLESVEVVAWSLILGGIVLVWADRKFANQIHSGSTVNQLNHKQSALLGVFQAIAMIPGVSRSGATIMGGLFLGMQKKEAAEFSFFLAVPTMAAATGYKLLKLFETIEPGQWSLLAFGCVVSFIVAILAIKGFIGIVSKYGFKYFGYYRIALGALILILLYSGVSLQLV